MRREKLLLLLNESLKENFEITVHINVSLKQCMELKQVNQWQMIVKIARFSVVS